MTDFEHKFAKQFKLIETPIQSVAVAVSGGVDSMVLLELLHKQSRLLNIEVAVAHIHHGTAENKSSQLFRDRAFEFVKKTASEKGLKFLTNGSLLNRSVILKSEAELREFRRYELEKLRSSFNKHAVLGLGQHRDDLLETRLIRLIRGTGAEGFGAMVLLKQHILRPLLGVTRKEILAFAKFQKISWVEDPSNTSVDPLRNWIRYEWLPQLEAKREGATSAMGRSFELLEEQMNATAGLNFDDFMTGRRLIHPRFLELSRKEKARVIARYLRTCNILWYARSHIEEILKRLDSLEKDYTFNMLGQSWHVSPDWIEARPKMGDID